MTTPPETGGTRVAEVVLPCVDLAPSLEFFVAGLGFRIEAIFPADDPREASLSGHGLRLRLAPGGGDPGTIRLLCDDPRAANARVLIAPNGTRIEMVEADPPVEIPPLRAECLVTRAADGPAAGEGRAGMLYRDLIPGRLGGRYIASHIAIPDGGPVADWVHFHKIGFQIIFCRRGWVRLVYEDQGPPFVMHAGDCVLQPPRIRHRVLESSPGLEVVEITCPALHETLADHALELPTPRLRRDRDFSGQRFHHQVASETPWVTDGETGFQRRETGLAAPSGGLVDARVIRPAGARDFTGAENQGELLFCFVLEGSAALQPGDPDPLAAGDAFVIPAGQPWRLTGCSSDLTLLQVMAPAPSI